MLPVLGRRTEQFDLLSGSRTRAGTWHSLDHVSWFNTSPSQLLCSSASLTLAPFILCSLKNRDFFLLFFQFRGSDPGQSQSLFLLLSYMSPSESWLWTWPWTGPRCPSPGPSCLRCSATPQVWVLIVRVFESPIRSKFLKIIKCLQGLSKYTSKAERKPRDFLPPPTVLMLLEIE